MIKITDKFYENDVFFPKTLEDMKFPIYLYLKNGKNQEYTKVIEQEIAYYKNFYCFRLSFADIPNGEYTYILTDKKLKEDGLIRIGVVINKPIENKEKETKIKQYGE